MKKFLLAATLVSAYPCCAQNYIDNYLSGTPTYTTITNSNIVSPRDLDFKPNTHELWIANKGTSAGGSIFLIYDAGATSQSSQHRKDSHTGHFMVYPTGIAFGEDGEWANTNEILSTAGSQSTFMGPALWSSDTSIFAVVFQNNWVGAKPLGSHLDMLHQSPYAMGIAHDSGSAYWVFDGHNGNLCKYDFDDDHSPGYDDHSNGKIWRYSDVTLTRQVDIPGHMVKDKATGWLYIVDAGTKRLIRVNTTTGSIAGTLTPPSSGAEQLNGYWEVTGATVQVIATFSSSQPCGVDLYNGRLIVGDYTTGDIYVYDVTGMNPVQLGTIATGEPGMMGVKIGADGKIWYVNYSQSKVVRINPATTPNNDAGIFKITSPVVNSYPRPFYHAGFDVCAGSIAPAVELKNTGANTLTSVTINYMIDATPYTYAWTGSLASGASTSVTLPSQSVNPGHRVLTVYTTMPNGTADSNPANDRTVGSFRVLNPVAALPFSEAFTATTFPPTGWTYIAHNFNNPMSHDAAVGGWGTGAGSVKMDNYAGNTDIAGQRDYLVTPRLNFSAASSAIGVAFDVAYAQYDANTVDSLEVLVSTDCGNTWTSVYSKSGTTLSTAIPVTSAFTPTGTQWRHEVVLLSAYAGQADVLIAFRSASGWGNNFYLDNINISNTVSVQEVAQENKFSLYPNPTTGKLFIDTKAGSTQVIISDIVGKRLRAENITTANGHIELDLSGQPAGTYVIEVINDGQSHRQKVTLVN